LSGIQDRLPAFVIGQSRTRPPNNFYLVYRICQDLRVRDRLSNLTGFIDFRDVEKNPRASHFVFDPVPFIR
jgi:hypothetical protein